VLVDHESVDSILVDLHLALELVDLQPIHFDMVDENNDAREDSDDHDLGDYGELFHGCAGSVGNSGTQFGLLIRSRRRVWFLMEYHCGSLRLQVRDPAKESLILGGPFFQSSDSPD